MKSRRRRKEIRQLARRASGGQPPSAPAFEELSCRCGHRLRLAKGDEGKTFICPSCRNGFKAARAADSILQLFPVGQPPVLPPPTSNSTSADTHAPTAVVEAIGMA